METLDLHPQYLTDDNGQKTAVLLPFIEFEELIEDLADLASVAMRINEPIQSLTDMKKEFEAHGLL